MKKRRALSVPFLLTAMLSPAVAHAGEPNLDAPQHMKTPPKKDLPKATDPSRVRKNADGTCTQYPSTECPPNIHCNPGPPRDVECPPEIATPKK